MIQAVFYHYLPSSDFVCDRSDREESEDQSKQTDVDIKTPYQLEHFSEVFMLPEAEDDDLLSVANLMEELDLGATRLSNMLWTPIKH
ncbi:hypothetical protein G6F37_010242 [Rhizopus arrhizus]|nr:hypothetical protein G6F38_009310 [Rhizopus arrhizus]KAG1153565.1 hypothetical protein G6F37_010242 [Rhizopus arrhizus]